VGQILSDADYFTRRLRDEIARVKRGKSHFSVVTFKSLPSEAELPEIACIRGLSAILTGVRETDCVTRIGLDTIAVLLMDAEGEGSKQASKRLLERIGDAASRWDVRVLDYPRQESVLHELGLVA
jgi:hypothetical protein